MRSGDCSFEEFMKCVKNLKEIEAAITAFSWMKGKEQTGIVREEDVTSEDYEKAVEWYRKAAN